MADPIPSQHQQQQGIADTTSTVTVVTTDTQDCQEVPTLTLRLRKPKNSRKVNWTTDTVDNEHMNKKKSKCCCIYDKPRKFGESSSEEDSDDECDHCKGHVEKKKHKHTVPKSNQQISKSDSVTNTITEEIPVDSTPSPKPSSSE